jgi:hypothetical protein
MEVRAIRARWGYLGCGWNSGPGSEYYRQAVQEERKSNNVLVPDIAQSIRIMPKVTDKLGLLDVETIVAVIDAYIVIEQFCERLIINGGVLFKGTPEDRRLIQVDESLYDTLRGGNLAVSDMIEKAIKKLDVYLK